MENQKNSSIPRLFIIASVTVGLLLAAFSIASGSNPLIQPDRAALETQLQTNPVGVEQLADWMVEGRRDFQVVGFRSDDACREQRQMTSMLTCYDSSKLKDRFWIRKTFKNIKMPLIVYGDDTEKGMAAAVELKHLGYDVRYLESGFVGFAGLILNPDELTGRYFAGNDHLVKVKGQGWVIASADEAMEEEDEEVELGDDEDDSDEEEDEEEEEGC